MNLARVFHLNSVKLSVAMALTLTIRFKISLLTKRGQVHVLLE